MMPSESMGILVLDATLVDFEGRVIRMTENRFAHIQEHPEMLGHEGQIASTLASPMAVRISASDPRVRLYYQQIAHPRLGKKLLCVVVKVLAGDAFVVTAYVTDKVKRGEQIWPNGT